MSVARRTTRGTAMEVVELHSTWRLLRLEQKSRDPIRMLIEPRTLQHRIQLELIPQTYILRSADEEIPSVRSSPRRPERVGAPYLGALSVGTSKMVRSGAGIRLFVRRTKSSAANDGCSLNEIQDTIRPWGPKPRPYDPSVSRPDSTLRLPHLVAPKLQVSACKNRVLGDNATFGVAIQYEYECEYSRLLAEFFLHMQNHLSK